MSNAEAGRPNILFILTDDQGPWAMGCAGNTEVRTPNLDRLAGSGMRFESFFCASPVCSPARASILTGRIPSGHGVHDWLRTGNTIEKYEPDDNGRLIEYLAGMRGYTDFLAESGYTCALSGKWHLGDCHHPQKGFSWWEVHAKGGGPYYNAPMVHAGEAYEEPRYVTDAITENALGFLEEWASDNPSPALPEGWSGHVRLPPRGGEGWSGHVRLPPRGGEGWGGVDPAPFYLSVHYTAPHSPWTRRHHPAETFDDYFENCAFASVPNMLTPPEWVRWIQIPVEDAETRKTYLSGYFTAVTEMDRNVGRLLDWLEAHNLREETLVVFMGDNGMCMGHHGCHGKGNATLPLNMFEESVRVPCIISQPGRIPEGVVRSELLSQYDFMPTLLDYLGIENPGADSLPGKSFAPLLRGEETEGREHVVVFDEYGPVRMVRTKEWKYVHRYPDGPNELYFLPDDPGEERNVVSEAGSRSIVKEMRARLSDFFARYADPIRDGRGFPVGGAGQSGLVGGEDVVKFY